MFKIQVAIVYGFLLVCSCGLGVPFCGTATEDLDYGQFETLCDSNFCVCSEPYGRVRCQCPAEVQMDEIFIKSQGSCAIPTGVTALSIDNCENVTVIKEAFAELKELRSVTFSNVRHVFIKSGAFKLKGPKMRVILVNITVVPDIPSFAFGGSIESITFENCYIGMIRAFAFSNIESAQEIMFRNSNVANVESQAFKKFPVSRFFIENSQFNLIPSRFLFEVDVENLFKIKSTFIDVIRTLGFKINSPKVTVITDSIINTVESEAFKIRTTGDVIIQNNKFNSIFREAFLGLSVEKYVIQNAGRPKFKFFNNSVINFDKRSFSCNRTSFDSLFSVMKLEKACSCDNLVLWRDMIHERQTLSEKTIEDDVEPFWCHIENKELDLKYISGREFYLSNCTTLTKSIFFFVIIIMTTAISLLLVIICIVCFMRRRRRYSMVPTNVRQGQNVQQSKSEAKSEAKQNGAKAIIVPDGRTYRETEFHVIVEKAEPLDIGYMPCKVVRDRSRPQISTK